MSKDRDKHTLFEETILPHLNAAYNLARWIVNNDQDAEDVVQESCLRAYKYFASYQGGNSRAWLLTIVRNMSYNWLRQNQSGGAAVELNDELASDDLNTSNPEVFDQVKADRQQVARALEKLPVGYRELIVLRELEEMSYKEIALIAGIPIGTVMSRLARARQRLKSCLSQEQGEEGSHGL
jgi:RNA polymerase sigma-70 factor, ECF subfamily